MKFLQKHLFLILACLSLFAGITNFLFIDRNDIGLTEQWYLSSIKDNIQREVQQAREDLVRAKIAVEKTIQYSFGSLQISPASTNPYFIYRNQQLVFWSDFRFVPAYQSISSVRNARLVNYDGGQFVATKWQFMHRSDSIVVVSLIPIYRKFKTENDYLKTHYNQNIFPSDPASVSDTQQEQPNQRQNIYDDANNFLFSVSPPVKAINTSKVLPTNTVVFSIITALLLGLYILVCAWRLHQQKRYELGFGLIFAFLAFIRIVLLYYQIPFHIFDFDIFNPKYYYGYIISPSLGDLWLNLLVGIIICVYLILYFFRSKTYYRLIHQHSVWTLIISCLLILFSHFSYFNLYKTLENISERSEYLVDFSLSLPITNLKVAGLMLFITLTCFYFLCNHFVLYLIVRLHKQNTKKGIFILSITSLVFFLALFADKNPQVSVLFLVHVVYIFLLFLFRLPRFLYSFRYNTSVYFFLGAWVCSFITAMLIYDQAQDKDFRNKVEFGKQYLTENDILGESLIGKASSKIEADSSIRKIINENDLVRERIQQLVKTQHFDVYLDKYATEIFILNSAGKPIDGFEPEKNLEYFRKFQKSNYQTDTPNLYFISDSLNNFNKEYVSFCNLGSYGYLILDMKGRNLLSENLYPDLFKGKKTIQSPETQSYSYIVFDKNKVKSRVGDFNYDKTFGKIALQKPEVYEQGLKIDGFRHIGVKANNGQIMVVSSPSYSIQTIFANFSFLFLLLVVFIILLIAGYALRYGTSKMKINFATKIQIYLNAAFLLPLLLVVLITLGVINNTFKSNQDKSYSENTKNIGSNVLVKLLDKDENRISSGLLEQEINRIASEAKVDISLFGQDGNLSLSTQPLVYQNNLLSTYINPQAYRAIAEDNESEILLDETLGNLSYKTAYIGLKSPRGELTGILGIPFFDSKSNLDQQIIHVVASILSIFALMFLLLLILSYFASNILTVPLRIFAQKIKKTNLDKLNEPLEWKSDDEIGLLISEYNRMLLKLSESKVALAQSEKQTAWREMAKQVAHEIKNPLTPMKLSIQQLQRTFPTDNVKTKNIVERALSSLIEQIDNISNIATSFSDFAKMPVPKNERFDLVPVIQAVVAPYMDDDLISLNPYIKEKSAFVLGDADLIKGIITNLIINGIQSTPATRRTIINLRLYRNEDQYVIIEVQDNGAGIPENIRNKVFIPNFTTKKEGSGLGLAMAKRGIEHAGGNIWFETADEKGTTFFIDLPLSENR